MIPDKDFGTSEDRTSEGGTTQVSQPGDELIGKRRTIIQEYMPEREGWTSGWENIATVDGDLREKENQ